MNPFWHSAPFKRGWGRQEGLDEIGLSLLKGIRIARVVKVVQVFDTGFLR